MTGVPKVIMALLQLLLPERAVLLGDPRLWRLVRACQQSVGPVAVLHVPWRL